MNYYDIISQVIIYANVVFMLFIVIVLPLIMFMSSFYFAGGPKNINNIFWLQNRLVND